MTVRYWTKQTNHGTGNTSDTNMWSATSGGTGGASVPDYSVDVRFDANSFDQAGAVVTHNSDTRFQTMDWTGALFNPTFARGASTLSIYGSLTFISGMTITGSSQINFRGSGVALRTVDLGGQTLAGGLDFYDSFVEAILLNDIINASYIYSEIGKLNTNGKAITCTSFNDGGGATAMILNLCQNALPTINYDTTGRTITGQIYQAHKLDNGNLLYCVARGANGTKIGVSEVNPSTNEEVFNWNDPTWTPTLGPECCFKYSNGNYLISDTDGGSKIYEMLPDHTKVWIYEAGVGSLCRPITVNGEDCILVVHNHAPPDKAVRIIKRSDQSLIWTWAANNYPSDGDYRIINGKAKVLVADCYAFTLSIIDYDTGNVDWTYNTGSTTVGPLNAQWLNDTQIIYANGGAPTNTINIINTDTLKQITWVSRIMDGTTIGISLYDASHVVVGDNTAIIKMYDVTQTGSTINCTAWNLTSSADTIYSGLSVIKVTGTGAFAGKSKTYNEVQLNGTAHTISGSNTFQRLKLASGTTQTITFTDTTTQTIVKPQSGDLSGSAGHVHTLQGSAAGGWALTKTAAGKAVFDYLSISRSTVTPGTLTWYGGPLAHSTDGGNNSGWIFTANPIPKLLAAGVI